ncbi:hypothetical protein [Bradyrhizobium sp. CCBAU 51753]|uniref:hypothetical protein n=1 Tax=Bradyrhizobium sp. CCBAU 51753 TaxID=1325100 RepID=UPI00188BCFD4|nr:hypothetical protein [Bradyrhizobium sp. CCBAU 51753]QOZ24096.1 hypothetical protein XH93_11300 [Bradyrhizobium sp. CCBAU 51753]
MTIVNIVDRRKRGQRFLIVNAIIEAAWHHNSRTDADQVHPESGGPDYAEREHSSLEEAVRWANSFPEPVVLYLYDEDAGSRKTVCRHSKSPASR